jgi:hypothetical protein
VAVLLHMLRAAGAPEQATALAKRAAAHAPLDDLRAVAWLLDRLRKAGASGQAAALAERAAAHVSLDDPAAVAVLLHMLSDTALAHRGTSVAASPSSRRSRVVTLPCALSAATSTPVPGGRGLRVHGRHAR